MKVNDNVTSTVEVKHIINGKKIVGDVSGKLVKQTTRVVQIELADGNIAQVTPGVFKNNFELDGGQQVDEVSAEAIEAITKKAKPAKKEKVVVEKEVEPQMEQLVFAEGSSRMEQVVQCMAEGMTSPTKIANMIGMNQSYAQRLFSAAKKAQAIDKE